MPSDPASSYHDKQRPPTPHPPAAAAAPAPAAPAAPATPLAELIRRAAENLPPPLLIFLFSLFAIYVLFSSSAGQNFTATTVQDTTPIRIVPPPVVTTHVETLISTETKTVTATSTATATTTTTTTSIATSAVTSIVRANAPKIPVPPPPPPPSNKAKNKNEKMTSTEQTFIAIKPDGVQRGLVGPIISRFENRGYKLAAIKLVSPSKEHLEAHYADLKEKAFFPGLIEYMLSGPICAMVWEGRDAVKTGRSLLGATNPLASAPGTIRGDFAIDVGRNVCHGSDSVENAKKEIALWFKQGEVISWESHSSSWVYEKA